MDLMTLLNIKKKATPSSDPQIIDEQSPFAIREAYKSLYTNVLYLNIEGKCKKIAVTSAVPGEGKSTVAANLAVTLAQNLEGKRVLLIDADMRRPTIARALALDGKGHGLSEYLAGIDANPHFDYISQYKLMVLTAGAKNSNPTKLIGSERMKRLIEACEEEFDYVIIDTPPVSVVTDAILLNSIINGYIIVSKMDYSNVNKINECVNKLEQIGGEIYGMVLSDVRIKGSDSRYSSYNRYDN